MVHWLLWISLGDKRNIEMELNLYFCTSHAKNWNVFIYNVRLFIFIFFLFRLRRKKFSSQNISSTYWLKASLNIKDKTPLYKIIIESFPVKCFIRASREYVFFLFLASWYWRRQKLRSHFELWRTQERLVRTLASKIVSDSSTNSYYIWTKLSQPNSLISKLYLTEETNCYIFIILAWS